MKKIRYIFLLLFFLNQAQITEIGDQDWSTSGNFLIKELANKEISEIKGSPYETIEFEYGKIIFLNGNSYDALMRLNIGEQKIEIKNEKTGEIYNLKLNEKVKIKYKNKFHYLHSIYLNGNQEIVILKECYVGDKYSLFFYPRKVVEYPKENRTPAPSSGFEKSKLPTWKRKDSYVIKHYDNYYILPNSHSKMENLNIIPKSRYREYRKKMKINLKKEKSLIDFVTHLNNLY